MIHGTTTSGDTLRGLNHDAESNHMNALLEEVHFRRQAEAPDVESAIRRFQGAIDTIVQTELRRFQFRLRTLTPDQQQTIETLLRGIATGILHPAIRSLQRAAKEGEPETVERVCELFSVGPFAAGGED
jgi:glutamyl-tRNA reductase